MDWTRINEAGEERWATGKGGRPEGIEGRIEGRRKGKKEPREDERKTDVGKEKSSVQCS